MSKVEIAAHLGISRFRVARLLDGALADGLVRIEYRDVPAEDRALATALEERFGLDLARGRRGRGRCRHRSNPSRVWPVRSSTA